MSATPDGRGSRTVAVDGVPNRHFVPCAWLSLLARKPVLTARPWVDKATADDMDGGGFRVAGGSSPFRCGMIDGCRRSPSQSRMTFGMGIRGVRGSERSSDR